MGGDGILCNEVNVIIEVLYVSGSVVLEHEVTYFHDIHVKNRKSFVFFSLLNFLFFLILFMFLCIYRTEYGGCR